MCIVLVSIICKWQSGIQEYCKNRQQEKTKVSVSEIFWIVICLLTGYATFSICLLNGPNPGNLLLFLILAPFASIFLSIRQSVTKC